MNRLLLSVALSAGMMLATALTAPAFAETVKLSFVQTNDIDRMAEAQGRGGFARLMAVVEAEKAAGNALFVHSGDTLSPSLLSGIDKGAHIIDILNQMGVDVMVPGNHEFDMGADNFRTRMSEAKFPVVSSNIADKDGKAPPNSVADKIVEVEGVKIGFYGLTTEETPVVSQPGDFTFAPSVETGLARAKALREQGAHIVVAVVHTPLEVDMQLARTNAADIILSGHDEHLLTYFDGRHVITESGSQADFAVITELTIERTEKDGKVTVTWRPGFRVVDTATVTPDPEIASVVKGYADKLDQELGIEIGTTETALDSRRATVRGQEAAIGNLIADAMRQAVNADVAITNGGGIRADKEYPAGAKITRRDIFSELPFGNKTVKLEVTGEQIVKALENGLSQVEQVAGRFPQVSGITVKADVTKPAGSRVLEVKIGGALLDPNKTYTLATNDFMANGGDGYTAFVGAKQLIGPIDAQIMASQVIDYVAGQGTISPKVEGRVVTR